MQLPTEPREPLRKNPRFFYIYGQEKIGKTTILSQLENCLIISTDPEGTAYVKCMSVQVNSYAEFIETCDTIIKQGRKYKYVAIDTTTTFEDFCEIDATKRYKASVQGKNFEGLSVLELTSSDGRGNNFSPGYEWLRMSFRAGLAKLSQTADHIIGVGHIREKYLRVEEKDKGKNTDVVSAKEIAHSGKIRAMITVGADAIGYVYRTANQDGEEKIWISFKTHEYVNCGTRCQHLKGQQFQFDWNKIYI